MIKSYLEVGKITSTHGVRGEMRVDPWCDSPDFLKKFKVLYLDDRGETSLKVISCRPHGNMGILKAQGIDTIDDALELRDKILYIKRSDASLPKGSYFIAELTDCTVIDAENENTVYGVLTQVSPTGANDVWHIRKDGREYLIPAIPSVVENVDVEKGIIKIHPMKGIFDHED